jgi:hypothetical protein
MDFTKLVSLLHRRALYFTNLERLSEFDAFEGLYTRRNLEYENYLQHLSYEEIPEERKTFYPDKASYEAYLNNLPRYREFAKGQRRITYVNCWHENLYESAAMWKTYLKSNEGIAIQSTVDRLKDSIRKYEAFDVLIGEVIYVDFNNFAIPPANMLAPFLYKRQSFEYEHELRALIWSGQKDKMDLSNPENAPPGLSIATDLDILIEKIYAAPRAEKWFVELLNSICSHFSARLGSCPLVLSPPSRFPADAPASAF